MRNSRRPKPITLSSGRWLAYGAASAATALAAASSAEAEIHYSGNRNQKFDSQGGAVKRTFQLSNGASIRFLQQATSGLYYGGAYFAIRGAAVSNQFRGSDPFVFGPFVYVSNLASGEPVSQGKFVHNVGHHGFGILGTLYNQGQFTRRGIGFIGFRFNGGAGMQYGWARLMTSGASRDAFILVDYAWGDPGDTIKAGQTSSGDYGPAPVPDQGSLGLLALGAAGLIAWRQRRARPAKP